MSNASSPRLLVVGGSGFIGSHVVAHACSLGWQVTSLGRTDRGVDGKPEDGVHHVFGDLADNASLERALGPASFEYVVNCGGYINHSRLNAGGAELIQSHFVGIVNLINQLDRASLRAFVNIGSSDEYGNSRAPQSESDREAPISPYSTAKVAASHLLQMLHRMEGFPSTTLRLFLSYGPGQGADRFLPQIITGFLDGKTVPVSAGGQLRDFCYIDDCVNAVFAALTSPSVRGEVINVASGQPVSIRQMIESCHEAIGIGCPDFGKVPYRPGENMELYGDISKAHTLLGWQPRVSLEDGLRLTIASIRSAQTGTIIC